MGGEGEEQSGGGWQRGWMRILIHSQLVRCWGDTGAWCSIRASLRGQGCRLGAGDTPKWDCTAAGTSCRGITLLLSLEEPEKQRARPAAGFGHLLLVSDTKLGVFMAKCGLTCMALLLCSPPRCSATGCSSVGSLGSSTFAASTPSPAWRRFKCRCPGCLQECDANRRTCLITSEQGGESSNAEREMGQVGRMGCGLGVSEQPAQPSAVHTARPGDLPDATSLPAHQCHLLGLDTYSSGRGHQPEGWEGAPSSSFSLLLQHLSQMSLSCSGCAAEEMICWFCCSQH